ncbi:MAG: hypothetical protein ACK5IJ_12125 [Mangrovibacterium sp.]
MKNYILITVLLLLVSCKPIPFAGHKAYWKIKNGSQIEYNYRIFQNGKLVKDEKLKKGATCNLFEYEIDEERVIVFDEINSIMDSVVISAGNKQISWSSRMANNSELNFFYEDAWQFEKAAQSADWNNYTWTFTITEEHLK